MAAQTCRAAVDASWLSRPTLSRPLDLSALRQLSQDRASALDAVAHLHLRIGLRRHQHVDARAKLDQPHALSALHAVTYLQVADDATRQQARDLLEADGVAAGIDG